MYREPETRLYEGVRASLEERGIKVAVPAERAPRGPQPRLIKTTYYKYGSQEVVKVTWAAHADFAARNAFYKLTQNDYAAGVAEVVDTGNFDELCSVLTRDIEGNIATVFKRDPKRPKLLLTGWKPNE